MNGYVNEDLAYAEKEAFTRTFHRNTFRSMTRPVHTADNKS